MELFSPLKMGALTLPNRIVMAPLTRGRAGLSRVPNVFMKEYYEMRASAGLIIAEATAITPEGYGWYASPGIYTSEQVDGWKQVTQGVHDHGGRIFLQLWHMGRRAHSSFNDGQSIVSPSELQMTVPGVTTRDIHQNSVPYETPRALRTDEIPRVIEDYVQAAKNAKEAGFDGIEVHAANGYLLDCFLQSSVNTRTDAYGGSKEKRFRIVQEIIERLGEVWPMDRIGIRFSPNGSLGSPDNFESFTYYASQLNRYGLAYLHLMDGTGYGNHGLDKRVRLMDVRKVFDGVVMGNVGYTRDVAEGVIRSGAADLVAFGRLYLSNPDLVRRFQENLPVEDGPGPETWFGRKPDAADTLEGYLTFRPYQEPQAAASPPAAPAPDATN